MMDTVPLVPAPADEALRVDETRCAWRQIGDEIVLLDLTGSVYFGLNGSATRLWPLLLAGTSRRALTESLAAGVGAPEPARADRDVQTFLDALDDAGLLVRPPAAGPAG